MPLWPTLGGITTTGVQEDGADDAAEFLGVDDERAKSLVSRFRSVASALVRPSVPAFKVYAVHLPASPGRSGGCRRNTAQAGGSAPDPVSGQGRSRRPVGAADLADHRHDELVLATAYQPHHGRDWWTINGAGRYVASFDAAYLAR